MDFSAFVWSDVQSSYIQGREQHGAFQCPTSVEENTMNKFVVGTRFFEKDLSKVEASLARLTAFIVAALAAGAEKVYVAVNLEEDRSEAIRQHWPDKVSVFPVAPWGKFVLPLNAILMMARSELASGCKLLLSSVEVSLTREKVDQLFVHMGEGTLAVGAALQGHLYQPGTHQRASGRQVPWNTLALWNPDFLWTTGFPMIGDGVIGDPATAGVEEVATIAVLQRVHPGVEAKLVSIGDGAWDTSHFDGERLAAHEKKMASKDARPKFQLEASGSGLKATVIHL